MKKLMMIAAMMLMSIGAFAQEGKMAVGANLGYAGYGDGYSPLGLGAKFQYEFVENIRGEFAYNYWFPKDKVGMMDFNLNFQYLFPVAEDIKIYPLVGVNMATQHGDIDEKESIFGFNLGAGAEYYLQDNLKLNLDIKYQHNKKTKSVSGTAMGQPYSYDLDIKFSGPVFQMGIAYIF
jgi:outer membrane protein X